MPFAFGGTGTGGGGGVLTLGPPQNSFTGSTRAAAETARNTYATANATWLAAYDAEPTFTIILTFGTTTIYQARRGGAWADVTGLVRGPMGAMGLQGVQGIFTRSIYLNAAAPPTAPTGGSIADDGRLTVPSGGWVAVPVVPPSGQSTYESQTLINPLGATFPVTPTWSTPFILPAYGAAGAAEGSAQAAAASAAAAAQAEHLAVGSPRGDLWATSPTLPVTSRGQNQVIEFGTNRWSVSTEGAAVGLTATDTDEEIIDMPVGTPPPGVNGFWFVLEVDGVETGTNFRPWGGHYTNRNGFPLLEQIYAGQDASDNAQYLNVDIRPPGRARLYGGATTLSANTVVRLYAAVVRGAPGTGGGGGGLTPSQVQALIDATNLSALQGQVTDMQIPAAIMRDAEFTSNAVIALITGNIAFSDISGMIADGQVPASFMRDAEFTRAAIAGLLGITSAQVGDILVGNPTLSGSDLTFTKADGSTETITLPSGGGMGTADGRLRFGTTAPAASLGMDGDSYVDVDSTAGTGEFFEKVSGAWISRATFSLSQSAGDHTRRVAISADTTLTTAEVNAGTSSTTNIVQTPMWGVGVRRYIFVGVPEDEGDITNISSGGIPVFGSYVAHPDVVEGHKWWRTSTAQDGEFSSNISLTITQ